jgi:glutamyl endopeptidase
MRSANSSRTRPFLAALIGGLIAALTMLVFVTPAKASVVGGTNDLKPTPDTTVNPYSAVAEIVLGTADIGVNQGKSLGACTGWFYAPNMIATAAHCVYDPADVSGGWVHMSGMRVWPGLNGSYAPFSSCGVTAVHASSAFISTYTSYSSGGDPRVDYAALKLDCSKSSLLNFDGLTPDVGYPTRVVGYPHNKDHPDWYPTDTQWYSDGHIYTYDANLVYYDNDTETRMSGAPVMEWTGSVFKVVAIHSRDYSADYNIGARITSAVASDLNTWKYQ